MKYLKKFENHAAYEAAESGLILPNVSVCVQENEVHYKPYFDPYSGHDYVEIGGLKWATMNIGAESVTDYGLYFAWGDTQGYTADQVGCEEGKKCFDNYWSDYKWTEDGGETFTKYNGSDYTVLQPSDDAVKAAWGGNWRMPTVSEFIALGEAVTTAWTADYQGSGVAGVVLTSNADGATLFFPACGSAGYGIVNNVGYGGGYWSSSLNADFGGSDAYDLGFSNGGVYWSIGDSRYFGCPVRGILAE